MASLINCVHWTSLWIHFRLRNLWCKLWIHRYNALKFHFYSCNLKGHFCSCDFLGGSAGKEYACNAGDPGLIPGSGRSPGGGHGNPFQYFCLENSIDRRVWQAKVHGVTKSQTWLTHTQLKKLTKLFKNLAKLVHYLQCSMKWKPLNCVWLFVTPWTVQSMEFSRPKYCSG